MGRVTPVSPSENSELGEVRVSHQSLTERGRPHRIAGWFAGGATVPGRALIDTLPLVRQVDVVPESWQLGKHRRQARKRLPLPPNSRSIVLTFVDLSYVFYLLGYYAGIRMVIRCTP